MNDYTYDPIDHFVNLEEPFYRAWGWGVMALGQKELLFLSTDGKVRIRDKTTGFFFATELDAHNASVAFYNRYGWEYPHGKSMMASAKPEIKSQTMRFK